MKKLPLILVLFSCLHLSAQSITGVWRGYFSIAETGAAKKGAAIQYNYEVQLQEKSGGRLSGVTYTYKSKEYFGKANFTGSITANRKNILISESALLAVEKKDKTDVCIMICNLQYSQSNTGVETLKGTFTSKNPATNAACFVGEVLLQRVPKSEFTPEQFLKKAAPPSPAKNTVLKVADSSKPQPPITTQRKKYLLELPDQQRKQPAPELLPTPSTTPKELLERENILLATVLQAEKEVTVYIYDNGIVDNDSVRVFVDGNQLYTGVRLSEKAISFPLHFSETSSQHQIVTYAENLGEIAPNTGLLVIKAGKKMIEIPIMSDFKKNAKIIINYQANCKVAVERYN